MYIHTYIGARVIEGRWRGCEWRTEWTRGELKGVPSRGDEGEGDIGWERNLIYRRLRSVIGLWRVPVRHAVMHEQRPITRNVTIRPGDLCAYPRNYFALGPRVMNTGLNSGPNRPLIYQTARKIDVYVYILRDYVFYIQSSTPLTLYNVCSYVHYTVQVRTIVGS